MWLVDRSRYLTGVEHCQMHRYLEYHSGPYGYGIKRKGTVIPLSTGTYVDQALSGILRNVQMMQGIGKPAIPSMVMNTGKLHEINLHNPIFRKFITDAVEDYQAEVRECGYLDTGAGMHTVKEQSALIEGLAWAWVLAQLPYIIENFEIVAVQQEETYVIPDSCTCPHRPVYHTDPVTFHRPQDHSPDCQGIVIMSKPDFLARRKADGQLGNHDFKTTAGIGEDPEHKAYVDSNRNNVQMAVGTLGAEARLGESVTHYYIHALVKGSRGVFSKKGMDKTGLYKKQYSDLCYAKVMYANPPILEKSAPDYKGFWYDKLPTWEMELPDKPKDWTFLEYWVSLMPNDTLYSQTLMAGPYERPTYMIEQAVEHIQGEELRWINTLWAVHNEPATINLHVSRSYDCKEYYGEWCPMYDICFKGTGWEDPLGSGKFVHRRPHHELEVSQMVDRGIPTSK